MIIVKRLVLPCVLMCLLVAPAASAAGSGSTDKTPVAIQADNLHYDKNNSTYSASGDVEIVREDTTLHARQVDYNTASGNVKAEGDVVLRDSDGTLTGTAMDVDIRDNTGVATAARGFWSQGNFHLTGDKIERLSEVDYRVENGTFTTCDGDIPSWKFAASELDVTLGGYARAKHVRFYIHDIPVLYFPYIAYPVKSGRESGFLLPMAGYSSKRGGQLSLAYYQVIARNQDATVYLDYFSKMGIGSGLDYRYVFGDNNYGSANIYYISDHGLSSFDDDVDDSYAFSWNHSGTLPGQVRLVADVEYVSEKDYFSDFGKTAAEYNKDEVESNVILSRQFGNWTATGLCKYTKDLDDDADNDITLQRLPEVQIDYSRSRLYDTPLYVKFDSDGTYFWRRQGVKGSRIAVRPALTSFFHLGDVLNIQPEIGYSERIYSTNDAGPGFEHVGFFDFSARISTRFTKVLDLGGDSGLTRIRHSFEPEVTYYYLPNKNQDRLPYFDDADRIANQNRVVYAVVNRFIGRYDSEGQRPRYRELAYWRLSQSYDIWLSRHDRADTRHLERFSNIRNELLLRPTKLWDWDIDFLYNPNHNCFDKFAAETGATYSGDVGFSAGYHYYRDDSEYLSSSVNIDWLKPVYARYEYRYDLSENKRQENLLRLEYRAQCWSLFLSYRDRIDDDEFMLTFTLGNLAHFAYDGTRVKTDY